MHAHVPTKTRIESDSDGVTSLELDVALIDANPFQPRRQFNEKKLLRWREHQGTQATSTCVGAQSRVTDIN